MVTAERLQRRVERINRVCTCKLLKVAMGHPEIYMSPSMNIYLLEPLALHKPCDGFFERVCQVVWSWSRCNACGNKGNCSNDTCCWNRYQALRPYLRFFGEASFGSIPSDPFDTQPSLRNADDILTIIEAIKNRPDCARQKLMADYFATYDEMPSGKEQDRAFDLAIYVLTTVYCSTKFLHMRSFYFSPTLAVWKNSDSAIDFVRSILPTYQPLLNSGSAAVVQRISAMAIEKAGIRLCGTSDLGSHLVYDPNKGTVFVFHLVPFLKESLNSAGYPLEM
jgi:hypothetical protein